MSRLELAGLLAILGAALVVRLALIDRPFHRDPEGCAAFYGVLARNYIRRPIAQTCGVPVMNMGRKSPPAFYGHHPPLVPMSIALVYWLFGFRADSTWLPADWQTRLPTVLFTLACIMTIYIITHRRAGAIAALIAAFIFAFVPITTMYGGFADVISPHLLLFILLTIGAYERLWSAPGAKSLTITALAFAPAAFTDWPAFFLPVVLAAHFLATRSMRQWSWIIGFSCICAGLFFLAYFQIWLVERDWMWIRELVFKRSVSSQTDQRTFFTTEQWLTVAWRFASQLHTTPILLLALLWMTAQLFRKFRTGATRFTIILLSWALLHILIGRQGVYQHPWWWWALTPGVAIASGVLLSQLIWVPIAKSQAALRVSWRSIVACGLAIATAAGLMALATQSTRWTSRELNHPLGIIPYDAASHSITEMGTVIRDSVPPDTAVIIVEKDATLGLWYYADRPLIQDLWSVEDLRKRLNDPQTTDLPFGWTEQWHEPPAKLIVPKVYREWIAPLMEYLRSHDRSHDAGKFEVFDLQKESPGI